MIRQQSAARRVSFAGRCGCFAAALGLAVAVGAAPARAQVLQQVPSDALVVIKVGNLKAVSDKVAKFSEAVGLAAVAPEFANPLASMQDGLGAKNGMDTAGEMAIVMTRPADPKKEKGDDLALMLLPVSDYKAFIANYADAKTDGAVTTFKDPKNGRVKYAAEWGKYAAVAMNRKVLDKKPTGLKLSGLAAKEAKEKDAFIFANIPALGELALPELAKARTKVMAEVDKELGQDADAKQFTGVAKAAIGQAIGVAEGFLRDASAASLSLHLNDKGLSTTAMAEFKPNTYGAELAAGVKNTDQPLMSGLPARKYFAVGGIVNAPETTSKMVGTLLDPIGKELAATEAGKSFAEAIEALKKGMASTKSAAFGYPMPTGALGADSVVQSISVVKGDAKTIHESQRKTMQAIADVIKLIPEQPGAPKMAYEFAPGGKTLGEVKLDTYAFNLQMDENNPQAAQAQQMMAFVYGPNGMGGVMGQLDKDTFVMVQGANDKTIEEAIKAAKAAKDPLSDQPAIKSVTAQLPAKRALVEYLFLDNMINAGVRYAQGFGLQVKMKLPADLPPIGVSAGSEGTALRFDAFVPTQTVQSVVAAGMQAFMEFQGGGAPGGPDGL